MQRKTRETQEDNVYDEVTCRLKNVMSVVEEDPERSSDSVLKLVIVGSGKPSSEMVTNTKNQRTSEEKSS